MTHDPDVLESTQQMNRRDASVGQKACATKISVLVPFTVLVFSVEFWFVWFVCLLLGCIVNNLATLRINSLIAILRPANTDHHYLLKENKYSSYCRATVKYCTGLR